MIVGLGSDICNIERITKAYERFGLRFTQRCFGKKELAELSGLKNEKRKYVSSLAKRFAAKEAFVKALGMGFVQGIAWQEIEVAHLPSGQPVLNVSGRAEEELKKKAPKARVWLSLSDDYPWAQAVVVIEEN